MQRHPRIETGALSTSVGWTQRMEGLASWSKNSALPDQEKNETNFMFYKRLNML